MPHFKKTILPLLVSAVAFVTLPAAAETTGGKAEKAGFRIAVISGVHVPHQGFALSASVPSDRMCVELAQTLASELGITVHLVCTDLTGGGTTIVAECGYADKAGSRKVETFSPGWAHDPFLICVPPERERFRAQRIVPNLNVLRPSPSL